MNFDITKIAMAILYFLENDVKQLSERKVLAMLFLIDFNYFEKNGKFVFIDDYIKEKRYVKSALLSEIFETIKLEKDIEGDELEFLIKEFLEFIEIDIDKKENHIDIKFQAIEKFDSEAFDEREFEILKEITKTYKNSSNRNTLNALFSIDKFREVEEEQHIF